MKHIHPVGLVILDGFGYSHENRYNAIAHAHMPHFNTWWEHYPHALLNAAGKFVGLPDGFCGNSEVGHLTIGAGRVIEQPMKVWLKSIEDGSFMRNSVLIEHCKQLQSAGGTLHIMGLLSDAGVHAHEKEIYATIAAAVEMGIKKIVIHPFLDGRDVPPQSAYTYLHRLDEYIKQYNGNACHIVIGSIHGRFYAMDRDNNWDRVEKSYRVLTCHLNNGLYETWEKILERNYIHNITDEFIPPMQLCVDAVIGNGDGIIFCNVRPDRARELTRCFVQSRDAVNFDHFILKPLILTFFITPTEYDVLLPTAVLFPRQAIQNTLKDVLAAQNKTIFTIAETEKYAHVTYFLRGENEAIVATETRVMIPSARMHDYREYPEMSAPAITATILQSLRTNPFDFYVINYANADMVGHSGDFDATVKAVECLDLQLYELYKEIVQKMDGTLYITADHGKAEKMYDEILNQPFTGHTNNRVPFIMLKKDVEQVQLQLPLDQLADIALFILRNMGLVAPRAMVQEIKI